jgi:DNA-binding FrmR family transcriptional regulator
MADGEITFKVDLTRRLRCAEGHLRGIVIMVEQGADCTSIVHQMLAVQGALREANRLLLRHHLNVCLRERLQQPEISVREKCMAEVISLYQLLSL